MIQIEYFYSVNNEHYSLFYYTGDGGKSWIKKDKKIVYNDSGSLKYSFADKENGWLIADDGKDFMKTADGGTTWTSLNDILSALSLKGILDIQFVDKSNGWVHDENGLFKTTDSGKGWKRVHDYLHVYRVLNQAMEIALEYSEANKEIILASSLLHDIGRAAQFRDSTLCHAIIGGDMAYKFLINIGWQEPDALHVKECITTHRFRTDNQPKTIEAKILFDADKLDITGSLGIARTLIFKGQVNEPLYTVDKNMVIHKGIKEDPESFIKEYNYKLIKVYNKFYTEQAGKIAQKRRSILMEFYESFMNEIKMENIKSFLNY
ncbi:MAG: HD domain-containing protein [Sedimentibacter sp.]